MHHADFKRGDLEFSVYGRTWQSAEALNRGTIHKRNTNETPQFMDEIGHDYRLSRYDKAARNTGLGLSFLNLPGFERDLYGNLRGQDRAWDRGAIEHVLEDEQN